MTTICAVRRYETILVPDIVGRPEPFMVLSRCEYPHVTYHCAACGVGLANVGQIEMHSEQPGEHRIAVWCPRHSTFEAADPAQIAALSGATTP
jgi:hypothetical protein